MRRNIPTIRELAARFRGFFRRFRYTDKTWRLESLLPGAPTRFSRRELLIGLLYASVALPGIVCSYQSVSKKAAARTLNSQHLHFPSDRAVGTLYVLAKRDQRRASRERENPMEYWERLDTARGKVALPRGKRVWLELNAYGLNHPRMLDGLEPSLFYRISLEAGVVPPSDAWYAGLARFTELRELDLRHAPALPANLGSLASLPRLARLWLPEPDGALERERLAAWAARAGMVEVVRNRTQGSIYLRRKPVDK